MNINLGRPQNTSLFAQQDQTDAGASIQENLIAMQAPDSMFDIDFNAPIAEL
jgi:hypothetical protein